MRNMTKIHCERSYKPDRVIGDWKSTKLRDAEGDLCYILCVKDARKWWEIDDVDEIIVTISTYATKSSYLCQLVPHTRPWGKYRMRIQAEDTGRWKRYEIYCDLLNEIEKLLKESGGVQEDYFYLGVEIPQ